MADRETYIRRITQANPTQLVVITFELTLDFIADALAVGETPLSGDAKTVFRRHIERAKNGVQQLINGLNFSVGMAHDFYEIYKYVFKLLTEASASADGAPAAEARDLLNTLLIGWRAAAQSEQAAAAPVMGRDAPPVYAGLTYQRDGLSEYVMEDEKSGYRA